jgi:hypothetical protein
VKGFATVNFGDFMAVLNLASVALCVVVALLALRHRSISASRRSRRVAVLLLLAAGWALSEAVILLTPQTAQKFQVLYLQFGVVTFIPLVWLAVSQEIAGVQSYPKRFWQVLTLMFVALSLLCLTNPWHELMLKAVRLESERRYPSFDYGPVFIAYAVTAYGLLFYGAGVIWRAQRLSSGSRRFELSLWLLCVAVPAATDLVSFTAFTSAVDAKLTPLALALSAALRWPVGVWCAAKFFGSNLSL